MAHGWGGDATRKDWIVVGAGAAGVTASALLAHSPGDRASGTRAPSVSSNGVLLLDAHAEPGGQAGWFARGAPRRLFDAGATQLVDCDPGGLHERLFAAVGASSPGLDRIPALTHHFPALGVRVTLHDDGRVSFVAARDARAYAGAAVELDANGRVVAASAGVSDALTDDLAALARVIEGCHREATWMWEVFHAIPRFPWQNAGDLVRAVRLARATPPSRAALFPLMLASGFATACEAVWGLAAKHVLARAVLEGLLLDTTQNSLEESPFLAGLMGASILRKGIHRARGGMRAVFRPLLSSARERGLDARWNTRVARIEPTQRGWLVHAEGNAAGVYLAEAGLVCNLTIWDAVRLLSGDTRLEASATFRRWKEIASEEDGWGAFAVYAVLPDDPSLPAHPWYHQIFPRAEVAGTHAAKANYVSIAGRDDPANPPGGRVLTTTLHVPAGPFAAHTRDATMHAIVARTEAALGVRLTHVESAVPSTYERYTRRAFGRVGGFKMSRERFLFNAPPSLLRLPGVPAPLALAGDTVFPGQGIIACMLSGIVAWERVTGRAFA